MSFPRYEQYKDSGVEWLGEVPEHWRDQIRASKLDSRSEGTCFAGPADDG